MSPWHGVLAVLVLVASTIGLFGLRSHETAAGDVGPERVTGVPQAGVQGASAQDGGRSDGTWEPSADPSAIKVGDRYYSVEQHDQMLWSRSATSLAGLLTAKPRVIWSNPDRWQQVWAPEITRIGGRFYVYFSAGGGDRHRMRVMSSTAPDDGFSAATELKLPDDKWSIDGAAFTFKGRLWFVWSGWEGDTDGEQNLYLARMSDPTTPTGERHRVSQPHETWEHNEDGPFINEGPQPILDPAGQLHIVYSAHHSWTAGYCLADLRLKQAGDPTHVWDWYKSNGCLMGSVGSDMMKGFAANQDVQGPGHHSFVLDDGDIGRPRATTDFRGFLYHGVDKGVPYSSANRRWHTGSFGFSPGVTYSRSAVPGDNTNDGYSPVFREHPASGAVPPVH